MPTVSEILTGLVVYTIAYTDDCLRPEHPVEPVKGGSGIETAIADAEKQIKALQRERVERLESACTRAEMFLDGINFNDPALKPHLCRYCKTKEYNGEVGIIHEDDCLILELRDATLVELEKK